MVSKKIMFRLGAKGNTKAFDRMIKKLDTMGSHSKKTADKLKKMAAVSKTALGNVGKAFKASGAEVKGSVAVWTSALKDATATMKEAEDKQIKATGRTVKAMMINAKRKKASYRREAAAAKEAGKEKVAAAKAASSAMAGIMQVEISKMKALQAAKKKAAAESKKLAQDVAKSDRDAAKSSAAASRERIAAAKKVAAAKMAAAKKEAKAAAYSWKVKKATYALEAAAARRAAQEVVRATQKKIAAMSSMRGALSSAGQSMRTMSRFSFMATAALGGAGIAAAKVAGQFESSLTRAATVATGTGSDFNTNYRSMSKEAIRLANITEHTSKSIGEGMNFMAMAGFKATDIIAAMPTVAKLATAANLSMADSANIVTNAITAFGVTSANIAKQEKERTGIILTQDEVTKRLASTTRDYANVLMGAFTASNVSLSELGESLKIVGSVANQVGIPIEDISAAIGLLGNVGVKGTEAGTGLKRALVALVEPSRQSAKAMKSVGLSAQSVAGKGSLLKTIAHLQGVKKSMKNAGKETEFLGKMFKVFGERAGPKMASLVEQGAESFIKLEMAIERAKDLDLASIIEERQLGTLSGAINVLGSNVRTVAQDFGNLLLPNIKDAIKYAKELSADVRGMDTDLKDTLVTVGKFALMGTVFTSVSSSVLSMASNIGAGVLSFQLLAMQGNAVGLAAKGMAAAFLPAIGVIAAVAGGLMLGAHAASVFTGKIDVTASTWKEASKDAYNLSEVISDSLVEALKNGEKAWSQLSSLFESGVLQIAQWVAWLVDFIADRFGETPKWLNRITEAFEEIQDARERAASKEGGNVDLSGWSKAVNLTEERVKGYRKMAAADLDAVKQRIKTMRRETKQLEALQAKRDKKSIKKAAELAKTLVKKSTALGVTIRDLEVNVKAKIKAEFDDKVLNAEVDKSSSPWQVGGKQSVEGKRRFETLPQAQQKEVLSDFDDVMHDIIPGVKAAGSAYQVAINNIMDNAKALDYSTRVALTNAITSASAGKKWVDSDEARAKATKKSIKTLDDFISSLKYAAAMAKEPLLKPIHQYVGGFVKDLKHLNEALKLAADAAPEDRETARGRVDDISTLLVERLRGQAASFLGSMVASKKFATVLTRTKEILSEASIELQAAFKAAGDEGLIAQESFIGISGSMEELIGTTNLLTKAQESQEKAQKKYTDSLKKITDIGKDAKEKLRAKRSKFPEVTEAFQAFGKDLAQVYNLADEAEAARDHLDAVNENIKALRDLKSTIEEVISASKKGMAERKAGRAAWHQSSEERGGAGSAPVSLKDALANIPTPTLDFGKIAAIGGLVPKEADIGTIASMSSDVIELNMGSGDLLLREGSNPDFSPARTRFAPGDDKMVQGLVNNLFSTEEPAVGEMPLGSADIEEVTAALGGIPELVASTLATPLPVIGGSVDVFDAKANTKLEAINSGIILLGGKWPVLAPGAIAQTMPEGDDDILPTLEQELGDTIEHLEREVSEGLSFDIAKMDRGLEEETKYLKDELQAIIDVSGKHKGKLEALFGKDEESRLKYIRGIQESARELEKVPSKIGGFDYEGELKSSISEFGDQIAASAVAFRGGSAFDGEAKLGAQAMASGGELLGGALTTGAMGTGGSIGAFIGKWVGGIIGAATTSWSGGWGAFIAALSPLGEFIGGAIGTVAGAIITAAPIVGEALEKVAGAIGDAWKMVNEGVFGQGKKAGEFIGGEVSGKLGEGRLGDAFKNMGAVTMPLLTAFAALGAAIASVVALIATALIGALGMLMFAITYLAIQVFGAFSTAIIAITGTIFAVLGGALAALGMAITAVVLAILAPIALLAMATAALGGFFLALAGKEATTQDDDYVSSQSKVKGALEASVDRIIVALDPLWDALMPLVGLFDYLVDVMMPLVNSFAGMGSMSSVLFQGFKMIAIGIAALMIVIAAFVTVLLQTMINVFGAFPSWAGNLMEAFGSALLGGLSLLLHGLALILDKIGFDDLAASMTTAATEAGVAATTIVPEIDDVVTDIVAGLEGMMPDMDGMIAAFMTLLNLTEDEARARAEDLAEREETENKMNESLTNVPSGFKVALHRFKAMDPSAGGIAGATGGRLIDMGVNDYFSRLENAVSNGSRNGLRGIMEGTSLAELGSDIERFVNTLLDPAEWGGILGEFGRSFEELLGEAGLMNDVMPPEDAFQALGPSGGGMAGRDALAGGASGGNTMNININELSIADAANPEQLAGMIADRSTRSQMAQAGTPFQSFQSGDAWTNGGDKS